MGAMLFWFGIGGAILGGSAKGLGTLTAFLMSIVVAGWGLGRWRVRRANPLPKTSPSGR
jgi:hypothetical protein